MTVQLSQNRQNMTAQDGHFFIFHSAYYGIAEFEMGN